MARRSTGQQAFTLLELLIVITLIAVISAIALPGLIGARIAGNEASALSALRTCCTVQEQYRSRFGVYATNLGTLGINGYVDSVLAAGSKSGYLFAISGVVANTAWTLNADPVDPGRTGDRYFFVDQSGVLRFATAGVAANTDAPIQ